MTIFEGLQAFLSANATLAAKLTGGIVPQVLPQSGTFPVLVVKVVSGASEKGTHDSGMSDWSAVRFEFTIWGGDFLTQEQSSILVLNMFKRFRGYLGGGSNVLFSAETYRGPRSLQDPTTRLVGVQLDILGMLNTATLS